MNQLRRKWLPSFILLMIVMSLAFSNCTGVNGSATSSSTQEFSNTNGSGNAGGYGGKPYIEIPKVGECLATAKSKTTIYVQKDGSGLLTLDKCLPIKPVVIPKSAIVINSENTLVFQGRSFLSADLKVKLNCGYTNTQANSDETLTVIETELGISGYIHRQVKTAQGYAVADTPFETLVLDTSSSTAYSLSYQSSAYHLRIDNIDARAYLSGANLWAILDYNEVFFDVAGQQNYTQYTSIPQIQCMAFR